MGRKPKDGDVRTKTLSVTFTAAEADLILRRSMEQTLAAGKRVSQSDVIRDAVLTSRWFKKAEE